ADDHVGGVGGPVARYYIVPNRFALEIDPALVDAGYETDEQGHGAPFIDVGASGAATFVPFGRVEIAVEGPRFSYRTLDRVPGTNLGLRLGFSLD
ncbi:MAG TPA: hypothetical protein VHB21_14065, partial [Minicystis sp.]|nr:hypothetical protein [Minicystis sp.]